MVGGQKPEQEGEVNDSKKMGGLSQIDFLTDKSVVASRCVAIVIANTYDPIASSAVANALKAIEVIPMIIGPRRSPIFAVGMGRSGSKGTIPGHRLEDQRSTMFDALFVPGGTESVETLSKTGMTVHYIGEAFAQLKTIGTTGEALPAVSISTDRCRAAW